MLLKLKQFFDTRDKELFVAERDTKVIESERIV